jgi:hypothetical protein
MNIILPVLALLCMAIPAHADIDFNNEASDFTTDCEAYPYLAACKNKKSPKQLRGEEREDYLADQAEKELEKKKDLLEIQKEIQEADQDLAKEQEE